MPSAPVVQLAVPAAAEAVSDEAVAREPSAAACEAVAATQEPSAEAPVAAGPALGDCAAAPVASEVESAESSEAEPAFLPVTQLPAAAACEASPRRCEEGVAAAATSAALEALSAPATPSPSKVACAADDPLAPDACLLDGSAVPPPAAADFPYLDALLDLVRQSHIIAGAVAGVGAGLVMSLRSLRKK